MRRRRVLGERVRAHWRLHTCRHKSSSSVRKSSSVRSGSSATAASAAAERDSGGGPCAEEAAVERAPSSRPIVRMHEQAPGRPAKRCGALGKGCGSVEEGNG
eukprot:scaffold307947_cov27-Tisochrysis_lutea.AAC.5